MAAYISVPRDLTRVKSKILFGLTKRQIVCFGTGALIGVPVYFFVRGSGNLSLAALTMIAVMLPFFFFGMYERNGQPPEVVARQFYQARFVRPKVRPYRINNYYAALMRQADAQEEVTRIVQKAQQRKAAGKPLLSKSERKKIDRIVKKARRDDGIPRTAQQTIPFERMFADGTCRVRDGSYTRTIQFQDINYQLALQEDKTAIFEEWCSFLNFFDSSVHFEFSFVNMAADAESFEHSIRIPPQKDGFDDIRAEYSQMLKTQLAQGNNGLTKTKYLTFGIEAASMRQAKPRLDHLQNDILNNFRRLGAAARVLNGWERLRLMHDLFHMDGESKFRFDWKELPRSGLSAKDFIAPSAFVFNTRTCQVGGLHGAMSFLSITASDLSDQLLKDFLGMESSQIVTMHIHSVDQNKAIKTVKRTITELDRNTIEEQKKAVRAGYDIDILPSDLATYGRDAKNLLKELQSQNERMFLLTFLILNTGRTPQELETTVFQAASIAQKHNCQLTRLDWQQEQGLMSSLPLAHNMVEAERALTTSSTAIFIPFTTQELFQAGEGALYYGLNALSNNLIMVDRKRLKNPNGLILGTPGSGKSFAAKREITNAFLSTDDDIIVCDPEAEVRHEVA